MSGYSGPYPGFGRGGGGGGGGVWIEGGGWRVGGFPSLRWQTFLCYIVPPKCKINGFSNYVRSQLGLRKINIKIACTIA